MEKRHEAMNDDCRLLKIPEAAERLSVSVRTLRALIESGKLPVIRISSRRVAVDPSDIDRYIAQQRK